MAGSIRYHLVVGDKIADIGSVSYTEYTLQEIVIATASTDTAINFGGVTTADVVYIKSDQTITINIDSNTGTDITLDANKPLLLTGTAITALYVSNASGSSANITIALWGA